MAESRHAYGTLAPRTTGDRLPKLLAWVIDVDQACSHTVASSHHHGEMRRTAYRQCVSRSPGQPCRYAQGSTTLTENHCHVYLFHTHHRQHRCQAGRTRQWRGRWRSSSAYSGTTTMARLCRFSLPAGITRFRCAAVRAFQLGGNRTTIGVWIQRQVRIGRSRSN